MSGYSLPYRGSQFNISNISRSRILYCIKYTNMRLFTAAWYADFPSRRTMLSNRCGFAPPFHSSAAPGHGSSPRAQKRSLPAPRIRPENPCIRRFWLCLHCVVLVGDFVIQDTVTRFDHRCDELNGIMRRVELALLLGGIDRKFFQEVFVHTTDEVFFFAKLLMTDFVDLIDQLFDVVRTKVARGKGALYKAAFQLLGACRNAVECYPVLHSAWLRAC